MKFNTNCIFFNGFYPCKFHKNKATVCEKCPEYSPYNKIIGIIKLDAIGDVLRTTAVLKPLQYMYPDSKIIWITRSNAFELFYNNDLVNEVVDYLEYFKLIPVDFDILINFDNTALSSSILSILTAKIKKGFILDEKNIVHPADKNAVEWYEMGLNDTLKQNNKKTYQRIMCDIIDFKENYGNIIVSLTEKERSIKNDFMKKFHLSGKKCIGIHPGSSARWLSKRWPAKHYISLIEKLLSQNITVIMYGSSNEAELIDTICENFPQIIRPHTEKDLRLFFTLLDIPEIIITCDSLALHAAAGLSKTVIALVGPTSASELEIYNRGHIITADSKCLCCYKSCCSEIISCMEKIDPDTVYTNILKYL